MDNNYKTLLKNKVISILKNDYHNYKSQNLSLSALALYQIDKDIRSEIISNYYNYNTKSKIQLSKLFITDKNLPSHFILNIIEKENSAQVKSLLYLHYNYHIMKKHFIPTLISNFYKEINPKVKESVLRAIRTQLKENCIDFFIDLLKNENDRMILYTVLQTLRSFKNKKILESTLNWIEKKGRYYDFNIYHHALLILIETGDKYLHKSTFESLLKKSSIDLRTPWNEEVYEACKRFYYPDYNSTQLCNPFREISLYPKNYFEQIENILNYGLIPLVLSDELNNQNDRDYFIDLVKFIIDILNTENSSIKNIIVTKCPNIFIKFEDNMYFNILQEFSTLFEYHKKESTCKICRLHFVHFWPYKSFYSTKNELIISKDYCIKHRYIELKQIAQKLVVSDYLRSVCPTSRKINFINNANKYKDINSIWKNEISKCKCGEQNFPLTIDNKCPLCHMKSNSKVNKNYIDILNSISENNSIHYDTFEVRIVNYYAIIEVLKNHDYKKYGEEYIFESYLRDEQEFILSWYIAEKIFTKVEYYDTIQWKSEQKAIELITEILKAGTIIRYKTWPWLISPISGYCMNVDAYFPEFNMALEYQGKQHFEPIEYFGGIESFNNQIVRDIRKKELLKEHGIYLIEIKEVDLTKDKVRVKLNEINIKIPNNYLEKNSKVIR
ncbi:MAG: hypothetical protein M0R34_01380 [Candidatus Marinimicrobia bacterium]|jgi:hypothetical protein|nr:hypothetical protein [Candidatus Neomarinimicrobiota bacterium]